MYKNIINISLAIGVIFGCFFLFAGTNNLTTITDGSVADAGDLNQFKTALNNDLVPRNSSGVPTDVAGGLGTTTFRWTDSYFEKAFIGTVGSLINLEDIAGDLVFRIDGTAAVTVKSTGLEGTDIIPNSLTSGEMTVGLIANLQSEIFTSSGTFNVPANVTDVFLLGCGGGGGGGGGSPNGAGAGGQGSVPTFATTVVTPSTGITVTLGGAGGGGTFNSGANGTAGSAGGNATFGSLVTFTGGRGGDAATVSTGGAGKSDVFFARNPETGGGTGATEGGNGADGNPSLYKAGGTQGGADAAGGGGSSIGQGGTGGSPGNPGSIGGTGGICAGGGGGGLNNGGGADGGSGGAGGNGQIIVFWWNG